MRAFSWKAVWTPDLPPLEVVVRAAIIYLCLITLFRIVPRKELARFSTSDVIVVLLVTTTVRRSIVAGDSSMTSALIGLSTILALDQFLNYLARSSPWWSDLIRGHRVLLVKDGELLEDNLARARITHDELFSRLRATGTDDISQVTRAMLERDGKVTFLFREPRRPDPKESVESQTIPF